MSGLVELEGNFSAYLARLRSLLDPGNLPVALPLHDEATKSIYGMFLHFTLDPETLEKTGDEVGTFSEQMKAIFGWKTRSTGDGIIPDFMRSTRTTLSFRNGDSILGKVSKRYIKYMGMRYVQVVSHIIRVGVTYCMCAYCSFQLRLPRPLGQSVVHLPPLLTCSHPLQVKIPTHPTIMRRYDRSIAGSL